LVIEVVYETFLYHVYKMRNILIPKSMSSLLYQSRAEIIRLCLDFIEKFLCWISWNSNANSYLKV